MLKFVWLRTIETKDGKKNIKIEWFSESEQQILKQVLAENWIILMSTILINNLPEKLYEVEIFSKDKETTINIIFGINWKNIRDAFKYFIETFWITKNINFIKPYWHEIEEEKLKNILDKLKKENWLFIENKSSTYNKKSWKKKLTIANKTKTELLENINDFIEEMEKFIPYVKDNFPVESKKIIDVIWLLKKYQKSTNLYKLSENYKTALEISEDLYNKYFESQKQKENQLTSIKLISELEIVSEYKNYEKIKRAKTLEKVDSKEFSFPRYETLYYKLFWKLWIHIKLIIQEILKKLDSKWINYNEFLLFFQFLFIFLILDYTILIIYFQSQWYVSKVLWGFYMIAMFSYFWLWVTIWKFFSNKAVYSIIIIVICFISWWSVKTFFWL